MFKATVPVLMYIQVSVPIFRDSGIETFSLDSCRSEFSTKFLDVGESFEAAIMVADGRDSVDDGEVVGEMTGAHKCRMKFSGHFYTKWKKIRSTQIIHIQSYLQVRTCTYTYSTHTVHLQACA